MIVFLSALENGGEYVSIDAGLDEYYFNLMSYYYLTDDKFREITAKSELVIIDSGAHSFQKGKTVDWENYTDEYARWIQDVDEKKIIGYFEMDIDPAGFPLEYVEELRGQLTRVSNKIIPVWHKNRGLQDFKDMCNNPIHEDGIVAITGFRNEDIRDDQYKIFTDYAHSRGCKIHCLGMTRRSVMDVAGFDFVDSSSWKQSAIYGNVRGKKITQEFSKNNRGEAFLQAYHHGIEMQLDYLNHNDMKYIRKIKENYK